MSLGPCKKTNSPYSYLTSYGKGRVWVVFFVLFCCSFGVVGQNPATEVPEYEWLKVSPMGSAGITTPQNIVIALDTDSSGNLYALKFGGKILKFDNDGIFLETINLKGDFEGLVDLAINSKNEIFVAHYEGREVLAFDMNGDPIASKNEDSDYFKPLGLAFDKNDNLYVLDYNDGSGGESDKSSRLKIYYQSGAESPDDLLENNLTIPYRIAVSSNGDLLISQAGSINSSVLIFNQDLEYIGDLPSLQSPGSITIDSFGFIHVIDYMGRVEFEKFLGFEDLDFREKFQLINSIQKGIDENAFVIKIFDSSRNLVKIFSDNDSNENNIEFPVDVAFNLCDKMFTDNVNIVNLSLEFDLEIYERTPSFDIENPVLECQENIMVEVDPGQNYATVTFNTPPATDFCSEPVITQTKGDPSGSQFAVGIHTIEFTATDDSGNDSTCEFTITVHPPEETEVSEPAFQNCPPDMPNITVDAGECSAKVTFNTPTASDENGDVDVELITGFASGEEFPVGKTIVTFEATNSAGNSTCSFEVTVTDNEDPEITSCPENLVFTIPYGETGREVTYEIPTFSDNCSVTNKVRIEGPETGEFFEVGVTTVAFEATDGLNFATCSFTVTIENAELGAPVFQNCPPDMPNITVDAGDCGAKVTFNTPTASDENGDVAVELITEFASGEEFPVGKTTVTFEATNSAGTSTCSFEVTVTDNEDPEITRCPENLVFTIPNDETGREVTYEIPTFSDNCSVTNKLRIEGPAPGEFFEVGVTTVAFEATDGLNFATCSFTVTIENAEIGAPVFQNCPPDMPNITVDAGECGARVTFNTPTASDENGDVDVELITEFASGEEFPVGKTTVTFEATNSAGTSTCSFEITVTDNEPPTIICPGDQTKNFDPATGFMLPDFTNLASADDNCEVEEIIQSPSAGTVIYDDTQITFTVTDIFGNEASCAFNLILTEDEVLEISCPADQQVEADEDCGFIVEDYRNLAEVNNDAAVISQNPAPGTLLSSSTTVVLTATLGEQNASCSFQVNVNDKTPPIAVCVETYTLKISPGELKTIPAEDLDAGSSDGCGILHFELSKSTFSEADAGENTIQFIVTDDAGNKAVCEVKVLVVVDDPVSPLECKEILVLELDENGSAFLTAEDLYAGEDTITFEPDKLYFSCGQIGEHQISLYDGNDPTNTCSTKVIVVDNLDPIIACAASLTVRLDANGTVSVSPQNLDNGSTDNCGIASQTLSKTQFTTANLGSNPVTYTVFDSSGNSSSCDAVIIVQDYVPVDPETFECISPVTVYLDQNGVAGLDITKLYKGKIPQNADISVDKNTFSCEDLPGTTINLTYTNGNEVKKCEIEINVEDSLKPVISVSNFTLELDENGNASLAPEDVNNGTSDNCTISSFSLSQTNFDCEELGENSVLFTAIDSSGNSASGKVIVTVTDPENSCSLGPVEPPKGGSFVIVYPNPGEGFINIKTSIDIDLTQVEVFDMRGRFLFAKVFENQTSDDYNLDLRQVQSGVYTLKFYSEAKEFIRRVIISTY